MTGVESKDKFLSKLQNEYEYEKEKLLKLFNESKSLSDILIYHSKQGPPNKVTMTAIDYLVNYLTEKNHRVKLLTSEVGYKVLGTYIYTINVQIT